MLGAESRPLGLFFNLIPGCHLGCPQGPRWPDVDMIRMQDMQAHSCLMVLLGPWGPDPASWSESWTAAQDLGLRGALIGLMLFSHHLEILNTFGTFSFCTGPHILRPVLLGIIWDPNAVSTVTPNDSIALCGSHLSAPHCLPCPCCGVGDVGGFA